MSETRLENKVKVHRAMLNMTQEQLAATVGVTRQTIIAIEKGNYIPSVLLAMRLALHLDCNVEELFFEQPAEVSGKDAVS